MGWQAYDGGASLGRRGSEQGVIVRDEEHDAGARITLERATTHAPWAVTCGVDGSFFHTRFVGSELEAEFPAMCAGLAAILAIIPRVDDPGVDAWRAESYAAIDAFVARFP